MTYHFYFAQEATASLPLKNKIRNEKWPPLSLIFAMMGLALGVSTYLFIMLLATPYIKPSR